MSAKWRPAKVCVILHFLLSGHGPRLILVRFFGFTSQLEERVNIIAVFMFYYHTEAFAVCRFLSYCVS